MLADFLASEGVDPGSSGECLIIDVMPFHLPTKTSCHLYMHTLISPVFSLEEKQKLENKRSPIDQFLMA
jgi:hypothetical protein